MSIIDVDGMTGQRLEGERGDEPCGCPGHHDPDLHAGPLELPEDLRRLVGGDTPGHTKKDIGLLRHGGRMEGWPRPAAEG